uniref:Uncharacterized protein n=1 Tax=Oryzias sinensis TaxID=183150 RepID=A0A8C7WZY0_9TELE
MFSFFLSAAHKAILQNEDLFSPSFCKVCSAVLHSNKQRWSHYMVSAPLFLCSSLKVLMKDQDFQDVCKLCF